MNLDEMLSQPLPPVADNGFAHRVIARIKAEERRQTAAVMVLCIAATTLLCLLVPVHDATADLAVAIMQIAMSPLVALAAAMLVLTFLIDQLWSDKRLLQL